MKKLITLLCIFAITLASSNLHAENIDNIISDISKEKNVDNVKVGGILMAFAKFVGSTQVDGKERKMINSINSILVSDFDCSDANKKAHYISRINKLKDNDEYETLMRVKESGENVYIGIKRKKDKIVGFYILSIDKESISAVKILGKFSQKDIDELMEDYSEDNNKTS